MLYTVDRTTGIATRVGSATQFGVSEARPQGLAWDGTNLYMVGNNAVLYTLDRTTGIATRVGSATQFGVSEGVPTGIAWDGTNLYMVGLTTDALYTLDRTTGIATRVGSATQFGVSEGIPLGLAWIPMPMVLPSAPTVSTAIPNASAVAGASASTIDLSTHFTGADSYTAESATTSVATVSVSGSTLTVTPVARGSSVITVTATNAGGSVQQTFTQTVTAPAPVDRPGTLTVSAVAGGRRNAGAVVTGRVTDPDGIRGITSTTLLARDGQTQTIAETRVDANTYGFSQVYNNSRWRTATLTVVYIDATDGESKTLTETYAV